jgi:zinc transporter, ZIP family
MSVATVFLAALVTALATGLGALPLLLGRRIQRVGLATAVAAGFMVGASVGLLWEGVGSSAAKTLGGVALGAAFIFFTRRQLGHRRHV